MKLSWEKFKNLWGDNLAIPFPPLGKKYLAVAVRFLDFLAEGCFFLSHRGLHHLPNSAILERVDGGVCRF